VIRVRELERQVERLRAENGQLKTQGAKEVQISTKIARQLKGLGIKVNSTLASRSNQTPECNQNPSGFLHKSINDQ
jgi:hypothetical protein